MKRKSSTSRRHLYLLRKVVHLSPCWSKASQRRSKAAPGSTSGGGQNLGVRWLTGPLGSRVQGCPVTRGWRALRWIHKGRNPRPVSASPHALPRQCRITSAPTPTVTHTVASRWRSPSSRVAGNGWKDATTPRQNRISSSFCLLKNPTFEANYSQQHNTSLLISTSRGLKKFVFFTVSPQQSRSQQDLKPS